MSPRKKPEQGNGRRDELMRIISKENAKPENIIKAKQLIEEIAFMEERLAYLRTLPHIKIDPKNPARQKSTPAAKQYKDVLQQYNNSLKNLLKISGDITDAEEESPLRAWARSRNAQ